MPIDTSKALSKKVFDHLERDNLSYIPENYELLYSYYEGLNANLNHAVDKHTEKNKKLDEQSCKEIYQQFLNNKSNDEVIRQTGERVYETVKSISDRVQEAKHATSKYSDELEKASSQIESEKDSAKLRFMIKSVMSETQQVLERNANLEQELDRSTEVMFSLQKDLEHVRQEAITDSLTDIPNRRAFYHAYETISEQSKKLGTGFTLMMIDIDNFKKFNDDFGHQVGDQVLRLVAKTLKDGIRGKDFVCRYGGEEFAVLLPDTPLSAGVAVGNNLRKTVATKDVVNKSTGSILAQITLSAGVAESSKNESMDDLIERADAALYAAKNNGRNQVASSYGKNK